MSRLSSRALANRRDKYLRDYCRKEYLNLFNKRGELKLREEELAQKYRVYESMCNIQKSLGDVDISKYEVTSKDLEIVDKAKIALNNADMILKQKKKEGRKTEEYRQAGLIQKPTLELEKGSYWYHKSLSGFREETVALSVSFMEEIGNSHLIVIIRVVDEYGAVMDGKCIGDVDRKEDILVYNMIKSINKDLRVRPEVIVLPCSGEKKFFSDYPCCYLTYKDFLGSFKDRIGIPFKSWLIE